MTHYDYSARCEVRDCNEVPQHHGSRLCEGHYTLWMTRGCVGERAGWNDWIVEQAALKSAPTFVAPFFPLEAT